MVSRKICIRVPYDIEIFFVELSKLNCDIFVDCKLDCLIKSADSIRLFFLNLFACICANFDISNKQLDRVLANQAKRTRIEGK